MANEIDSFAKNKIHVLMVDDDLEFIKLTELYLKKISGDEIDFASCNNSVDVLGAVKDKIYDILITDYQMPQMNGLELLKQIRSDEETKNLPVIIFTGKSREEIVIQALNMGVNQYITKGSDWKSQSRALLHSIREIVEHRRTKQALEESEEKYRLIYENEKDAILILDLETLMFMDINPAAEDMYGYSREEFLKLHVNDITAEPEKTARVINKSNTEKTVKVSVRYNKRMDGSIFKVEFSSSQFIWKNKKFLSTIVRKI